MDPRVMVKRLTEADIANAIRHNTDSEGEDGDLAPDEEEYIDEDTDSEDDHFSENKEEEEEEEEEQDEEQDVQMEFKREQNPLVYIGRDTTEWSSTPHAVPPTNQYRRRIRLHHVNLQSGQHLDLQKDCFRCIIDDTVIAVIVRYTNIEARKHHQNWKPVDHVEIEAFIGLLIIAGVDRSSKRNYEEFFGTLRGLPIFKATMSRNRFKNILRYIRFDDKDTRSVRRARDKLAPIRDIFDTICKNLCAMYSPGENLTIDEQLVPFRGRCSFKQYLPSKPDKYGLKLFWICDAETWYPLQSIPYLGRERSGSARRTNIALDIVSELCVPYYRTNRNITFDNFFTSYELAEGLLAKGLTTVGTVRKNKAFLPREFLSHRSREVSSNLFGFRPTMTLLSHVPRRNKAVVFLSTLHHTARVEETRKAEINEFYNKTKGGVDVLDELCHTYSVQRRTKRWPFAVFMNLINVAGIAGSVLWQNVKGLSNDPAGYDRKIFLTELARQMTFVHIKRRSMMGLQRPLQDTIQSIIRPHDEAVPSQSQQPSPNTAKKRRRTKQICSICKRNVCKEHAREIINCVKCKRQPIINSSDSE